MAPIPANPVNNDANKGVRADGPAAAKAPRKTSDELFLRLRDSNERINAAKTPKEKAEALVERVGVHIEWTKFHSDLLESELALNQVNLALKHANMAIRYEPENAVAHVMRVKAYEFKAEVYLVSQMPEAAEVQITRVLEALQAVPAYSGEIAKEPGLALSLLSDVAKDMMNRGKTLDAIAFLESLLKVAETPYVKSTLAESYVEYATQLQSKGYLGAAMTAVERAHALDPENTKIAQLHNPLVAFKQGDYDTCINLCVDMLKNNPDFELAKQLGAKAADIVDLLAKGSAFEGSADFSKAISCYKTALELDPTSTEAQKRLGSARQCLEFLETR